MDERDRESARFHDVIPFEGDDVKVWRCDWGWRVERGDRVAKSRFLDAALEKVLGRLDRAGVGVLLATLERELEAERHRTGKDALRVLDAEVEAHLLGTYAT